MESVLVRQRNPRYCPRDAHCFPGSRLRAIGFRRSPNAPTDHPPSAAPPPADGTARGRCRSGQRRGRCFRRCGTAPSTGGHRPTPPLGPASALAGGGPGGVAARGAGSPGRRKPDSPGRRKPDSPARRKPGPVAPGVGPTVPTGRTRSRSRRQLHPREPGPRDRLPYRTTAHPHRTALAGCCPSHGVNSGVNSIVAARMTAGPKGSPVERNGRT